MLTFCFHIWSTNSFPWIELPVNLIPSGVVVSAHFLFSCFLQDNIGFNLAGLHFIQNEMEAKQETFFADATEKVKKIRKRHKSAVVQVVK